MADLLVGVLKQVRQAHGLSQAKVEECMHLSHDTYRHIERGRRPPPDFRHGLVAWVKDFETCVEATFDERRAILEALSRQILDELSDLLP